MVETSWTYTFASKRGSFIKSNKRILELRRWLIFQICGRAYLVTWKFSNFWK